MGLTTDHPGAPRSSAGLVPFACQSGTSSVPSSRCW